MTLTARNPRVEATALLPPGHEARVLEPSPPANLDPDWYADDPTDPTGASATVVTPIPGEGITWADLGRDENIARFAHDHWLDGRRPLQPLPERFQEGRRALHQLAYFAVAPARFAATGKLGLRYTHRGFGTPFFGESSQVRIEDDAIVLQMEATVSAERVTTLRAAADFLGIEYRDVWFEGFQDPLPPIGPDTPLEVEPSVTEALGMWFGFATHVLERARRIPGAIDVSRVQLWPEHFDPAFEMGSASRGRRASYGASPGDKQHPEPYLYIAAWGEVEQSDPFWNDRGFNGARLDHLRLCEAEDPYELALAFFRDGHARLAG